MCRAGIEIKMTKLKGNNPVFDEKLLLLYSNSVLFFYDCFASRICIILDAKYEAADPSKIVQIGDHLKDKDQHRLG